MRISPQQAVSLIALLVVLFIAYGLYIYTRPGQAVLTRNLPQNDGAAGTVFSNRLRKHFGAKSGSEDSIKSELENSGFEVGALASGTRVATYRYHRTDYHRNHCDVEWTIRWDANAKGEVFRMDGQQHTECAK